MGKDYQITMPLDTKLVDKPLTDSLAAEVAEVFMELSYFSSDMLLRTLFACPPLDGYRTKLMTGASTYERTWNNIRLLNREKPTMLYYLTQGMKESPLGVYWEGKLAQMNQAQQK